MNVSNGSGSFPQKAAGAGQDQIQQKRSVHILMADDEPGMLRSNKRMIQPAMSKAGLDAMIETAENGQQALDMINSSLAEGKRPDLCIFDCDMPIMDGITALKEVKKLDSTIPVIIYTAMSVNTDGTERAQMVESLGGVFVLKDGGNMVESLMPAIKKALNL